MFANNFQKIQNKVIWIRVFETIIPTTSLLPTLNPIELHVIRLIVIRLNVATKSTTTLLSIYAKKVYIALTLGLGWSNNKH
jgi:hypothetical protein